MAKHDKEKKGIKMDKHVFYDKGNDILSIHKGFAGDERFKGNIDAGDLVLDVSTKGRIRGIEIMNAASFLKEFGMEKKMLEELAGAEFNACMKPNSIVIGMVLKAKNIRNGISAKIAVPLETAEAY